MEWKIPLHSTFSFMWMSLSLLAKSRYQINVQNSVFICFDKIFSHQNSPILLQNANFPLSLPSIFFIRHVSNICNLKRFQVSLLVCIVTHNSMTLMNWEISLQEYSHRPMLTMPQTRTPLRKILHSKFKNRRNSLFSFDIRYCLLAVQQPLLLHF